LKALRKKAGPLAYAFTCVTLYGFVINCGDKPTLSRISSKCRPVSADVGGGKKPSTSSATSKKTDKKTSLTTLTGIDDHGVDDGGATIQIQALALDDLLDSDNGDESLGLADDPETFYNTNTKSVIDGKCVSCHKTNGTSPPLDTYANVKKNANDVLRTMKATDQTVMPQSGRLPESEISKVAEWVALLSGPSSGSSTSTDKSAGTGSSIKTDSAASKAPKSDECKPDHSATGTSTSRSTKKRTGTGTGTSTRTKTEEK
jgi:mono/diheme cytochrome c family protein